MDRARVLSLDELTRRDFLKLGGLGLAGATVLGQTGCGIFGSQGGSGGGLVYVDAGGALQEASKKVWLNPFAEQADVEVTADSPMDSAQLQSMVENNQVTWDVAAVGAVTAYDDPDALFERLDYSNMEADGVPQNWRTDHAVGYMVWGFVVGYNTDTLNAKPSSWADFFDLETFPGDRGYSAYVEDNALEAALLADGIGPDELYPIDVDRALAKLDTIRDNLVFYETGADAQQQLADGEVVMSFIPNGRVQSAIDGGAPLAINWEQHITRVDYLVIPKGAPNVEQATKLVSYIVAPENNWRLSENITYGPSNQNAVDKVPQDVAPQLATYQDRPSLGISPDTQYIVENLETLNERWNEWKLQ